MKKLFVLILMISASVLAQGPGFFPWWDSPVARDMNLSESQKDKIRETVRSYRDQLIQQRADLQKAEGNLQDLMNEDQVNEARTTEAIEKVVAARAALTRTFSLMSLKLRLLLSPDQWRELERRRGQRRFPAERRSTERLQRRPDRRRSPEPPQTPDAPQPPNPGQ